jgi:hypothetical protein
MPAPVTRVSVVAEVQATPAQRETVVEHSLKPSVPEALAASTAIESARSEAPSAPVHELAMRVAAPDSQPVDVRVSHRGGEVHVAVRTADAGLQASLRSDLGSLVEKLEQSGFRTETAIPEATRTFSESNVAAHQLTTHSTADLSGSGTYGESGDKREESHGSWTGQDSRQSDHRQQRQQQNRRPARAWEEMMEETQ